MQLEEYLERLERAEGLEDLQALIVDLRDSYNVVHIVYHWVSTDGEQFGFGTYAPTWVQRYVDRDYLRVDPVVLGCFHAFHPVDWNRLDWSSRAAKAFRADAVAHGVGQQGLSIPIRGPSGQFAMFTISDQSGDAEWDQFTRAHQRDLILIAHYFNHKALDIARGRNATPPRALSPREVDTLTFLAMGYSRGQVADMLHISEHTVRAYVESARFKLGAMNTTHAVARAMAEGLIVVVGAARNAAGGWPGRGTGAATLDCPDGPIDQRGMRRTLPRITTR